MQTSKTARFYRDVRGRILALATGLALGFGGQASADGIAACAAIEAATERLACFDRLADAVPDAPEPPAIRPDPKAEKRTQPTQAPTLANPDPAERINAADSQSAERSADAPPARDDDEFGFEFKRTAEGPDRIVARVVGEFRGWNGDTVFELDNGQVWEQVNKQRFRYSGPDRTVEIRRASFGSFLLSPEGLNRRVRVARVE